MIRVAVIADSLSRARNLADLLAEETHFEVIEARAWSRDWNRHAASIPDVVVAAGLRPDDISADGPPVVALSGEAASGSALHHGVRAWLPLESSATELAAAIAAAASDLSILTQSQVRRWLRGAESAHEDRELFLETLTPREAQVLRMLADGLGNKQIARQLGISDHTAKFHVAQILAKLGVGSRAEAVAIGIRRGLVPI